MTRICIFGAGAIGGYVGARLAMAGEADVSLVARGPHLAAMQRHGLVLKQDGATRVLHPEVTDDPRRLGPVAAAGEENLLLGDVRAAGTDGGYWIWAAMDNLLRGGATNAIALAERLLGAPPPA